MRNDVSIPPEESDSFDDGIVVDEPQRKNISTTPIPPPDGLKADVELFDHPNFSATGIGNFWTLGIFGVIIGIVAIALSWVFSGYMR